MDRCSCAAVMAGEQSRALRILLCALPSTSHRAPVGHEGQPSNEALLPTAQAREAADSLRSLAAIMIGRRSRAPRR